VSRTVGMVFLAENCVGQDEAGYRGARFVARQSAGRQNGGLMLSALDQE